MTVKQTSWSAYQDVLRGGVAKTQAEQVLQVLNFQQGPVSRASLSKLTGISINAICGRVNELLAAEVIYVAEVSKCEVTGRSVEKLGVVGYD